MAFLVTLCEARRFMVDCLVAVGTCREHAEAMAEMLAAADYRGHYSHGMNRIEVYVDDIIEKRENPNATPCILNETAATAWVDGRNGLGGVVGNFCMQLAIKKAKQVGIGWVVAKGSNHFGTASYYSTQALQEGILGICMTNSSPVMSPTRAKEPAFGNNPFSVAAPGLCDESIMVDIATTAVALGKIEYLHLKGQPIPEGWAQGPDGNITTDAAVALKTTCLMPLGGTELTSGHKGYGLSLMVEMLSGLLAGSAFGPKIRRWKSPGNNPANLGHCFGAIDPSCFAPGYQERLTDLNSHLRRLQPVKEDKPVIVPGDPEKAHMRKVDEEGGINYVENQMKYALELANKLKVKPLALQSKGC